MDIYGIIGNPLGHSCSPRYFNEYFQNAGIDAMYLRFEMKDIRELEKLLHEYPQLKGFNVTIPHKQNILPFLNEVSDEARTVGAVNCVKIGYRNGRPFLSGYNTDTHGFRKALMDFIPSGICQALILGNGGAAKAVRYVLQSLSMKVLTVSRTPRNPGEISYADISTYLPEFRLIVNTTPLGTWPKTESYPDIPYKSLTPEHYLFDLVYNPAVTTFMQKGRESGAHTCNGLAMWLGQAEKNREIWHIDETPE